MDQQSDFTVNDSSRFGDKLSEMSMPELKNAWQFAVLFLIGSFGQYPNGFSMASQKVD
jgi:hypothetical protein